MSKEHGRELLAWLKERFDYGEVVANESAAHENTILQSNEKLGNWIAFVEAALEEESAFD